MTHINFYFNHRFIEPYRARSNFFIILGIMIILFLITCPTTASSDTSTPITIQLTQPKIPLVNEENVLHIKVNSIFDAPGTEVKIILPSDVELISGSLDRNIDLQANTPVIFETTIKFTKSGNFKITALAHKAIDLENSWGDMDVIYLTIGEVSSKISTFSPIAYAERAQSMSEQPVNVSEISTIPQNLSINRLVGVMPVELPLDSNLISAEPPNIYSTQSSSDYTI